MIYPITMKFRGTLKSIKVVAAKEGERQVEAIFVLDPKESLTALANYVGQPVSVAVGRIQAILPFQGEVNRDAT